MPARRLPQTPVLSRFETRAQRFTFLVLTLALLAIAGATVLSARTQIGLASPGFVVWRNLVVPAIGTPGWPGSRAGVPLREVVVAVGDAPVHDAAELRAIVRAAPLGAKLRYVFARNGVEHAVVVPTTRLRWRDVLPVYAPYWLDGIAFFVVGLVVFYFRPALPAARAALALGTILGSVLVLASDVFAASWLDRLYFCVESLTPGALLHFALCFPEEKRIARRRPWLKLAVYLPFVPFAVVQNLALSSAPERHLAANDLVYTSIAVAGLVLVASLVHTVRASENALARQQAKVVMAGVALAALVPSLGILAIIVGRLAVPMNLLAPFYIVYPLSIGYAIARHDLFSVDRYLRTGVVYGALSLIVFVSYAGVVLLGEAWLGPGEHLPGGVVPVYVLIVLVVLDPLRSAIQRGVDRLFDRQAYSYRATVLETSRALASVLDTDRIAAIVIDTLTHAMAVESAVLLLFGDDQAAVRTYGEPPARAAEAARLFPAGDATLAAATRAERPISKYDAAADARTSTRGGIDFARFAALGTTLLFPLRFDARPLGVLLVGDKRSGAFYTDEDIQLLGTLANQCALALNNAHAYEIIRKTQAELVDAERMAAVGELASSVAHGIRNPLAGIRAAAQLAREDVEADSEVAESLDDIVAASDRLERRVRSILDLARPVACAPRREDSNAFLRAFAAGLRERLPSGMRLATALDPDLPPARFDRFCLTEVLDALAVNAVESQGGTGSIELRSRLEQNGGPPRVAISVADRGPGIDAARLPRVFDLFYTSKPTGTGVGLAMAKRLVERQGGTIEATSPAGGGAVFTVRLPVAESAGTASA